MGYLEGTIADCIKDPQFGLDTTALGATRSLLVQTDSTALGPGPAYPSARLRSQTGRQSRMRVQRQSVCSAHGNHKRCANRAYAAAAKSLTTAVRISTRSRHSPRFFALSLPRFQPRAHSLRSISVQTKSNNVHNADRRLSRRLCSRGELDKDD